MLRKIRITLAALFLVGITLLFVGIGRDWWGWMPKLQLLPAAMRIVSGATLGNVAVVAAILLVTLVFGRIYCSVICPLGVFQDVVMWLRRQLGLAIDRGNVRRAKKAAAARKAGPEKADPDAPVRLKPIVKHFKFSPERRWPRFIVLAATVVLIILNIQFIVALIAPYSAYGRIVATAAGLVGGATPACALLWTAIITFVVIAVSAWQWGRAWCNTICPVGTVLGYVSKAAIFRSASTRASARHADAADAAARHPASTWTPTPWTTAVASTASTAYAAARKVRSLSAPPRRKLPRLKTARAALSSALPSP